jgi:hypothetical protein
MFLKDLKTIILYACGMGTLNKRLQRLLQPFFDDFRKSLELKKNRKREVLTSDRVDI